MLPVRIDILIDGATELPRLIVIPFEIEVAGLAQFKFGVMEQVITSAFESDDVVYVALVAAGIATALRFH